MNSGFAKALRTAPPSARVGIAIVLVFVFVAAFAPWLAPHGETEVVGGEYEVWFGPFFLGTDNLGRDLLSRLMFGARNTVGIAFVTTMLSFAIGATMGLVAALLRGWVDFVFSRLIDVLLSIPSLIFALLLLTIFSTGSGIDLGFMRLDGAGTQTLILILVIAVLDSTKVFRLTRAVAGNIVVLDYIEVARLRGEGLWWLLRREVLPNCLAPLMAEFGLRFCFVFLFISALSFLGLGIQPPIADWGSMVRENASLITFAADDISLGLTPLLPAGAIALLTVGINLIVDWMLHRYSGLKE